MQIKFKPIELELEFLFAISRGSKSISTTVLVEIEVNGYKGLGEAVFSRFYGETQESVCEFYQLINEKKLLDQLDIFDQQSFEKIIETIPGNYAAKSGLEIALYDLRAKTLNLPLYKFLGLDKTKAPKTSYTIGIADLETMKSKTLTAIERGYDVLKVKLGTKEDIKIIEMIRSLAPKSFIRVDANAAWNCREALETLNAIKEFDIEFVEEPLVLDSSPSDYQKLFEESPLPLMADESCKRLVDIPYCAKCFHMINIKHTKSGGLAEAIRMINAARAHNMKIMLGCFTETNISISAFAHISPLVDFADLDGALLLKNDPYKNDLYKANQICLSDRPGLGV